MTARQTVGKPRLDFTKVVSQKPMFDELAKIEDTRELEINVTYKADGSFKINSINKGEQHDA